MASSSEQQAQQQQRQAEGEAGAGAGKGRGPRYRDLFKYAGWYDKLLILVGTLGAAGEGVAIPIIGGVMNKLVDSFGSEQDNPAKLAHEVSKYSSYFVYVAIGAAFACYLEVSCWVRLGERQSAVIRAKYLRAILRQNVGFFDGKGTSTAEVVSSVAKDSALILDAMSEKAGNFIANTVQFLAAYAVGFYICWQLSFLAVALTPMVIVPGLMYKKALTDYGARVAAEYERADAVVEQAVAAVRTVYSFTMERRTVAEFVAALEGTVRLGVRQGLAKGVALASTGMGYLVWAVMAWVGQTLVQKGTITGSQVVITGFIILTSIIAMAQATPSIRSFTEGTLAAHRMFQVIDRVPPIDTDDTSGATLDDTTIQGRIELRSVTFRYPSRPDVPVLTGFNLRVAPGTNVALVGSSGSGKSTVIALLERFYDPLQGEVLIDDVDIRSLQLKSLRRHIGLVSQEPALFATSVRENILYGKEGASVEQVVEAAKSANAHGFISQLPQGYDTQVGERGVQMSGGQKQRIAIARALLRNPPILLLDEATSALDAQSEKVVQETLEKVARGRTTITVAHRLSTIRGADSIAVMQAGVVVEMGDHDELMARGGVYTSLVSLQQSEAAAKDHQHLASRRESSSDQLQVARRSSHANAHAGITSRDSRSRSSSFRRTSSLSRSFKMLQLTGSLRRALGEGVAPAASGKAAADDDFDTIIDQDANAAHAQADKHHHHWQEEGVQEASAHQQHKGANLKDVTMTRLLALNAPEWKQATLGVAGAVGFGLIHPLFAFLLGELLEALYKPSFSDQKRKVNVVGSIFIGMAVINVAANITQHYFFAVMGEKLTSRIRAMMLTKILGFEVAWFDRDDNSSGALCARLSSDASLVRTVVGDRLCLVVSTFTAVTVAYTVGLVLSWRIALVLIAVQPLLIVSYAGKRSFLTNFAAVSAKGQLAASQVAGEAVSQLRTVAAFSAQDRVLELFQSKMRGAQRKTARISHVAGAGIGVIVLFMYCSWALSFWYGAQVVKHGHGSFGTFFKAFFVLVATSRVLADTIVVLSPDLARGSQAVKSVFQILDRQTRIDADAEPGGAGGGDATTTKPATAPGGGGRIAGAVELEKVSFAYPARPHILVFKGFQLAIPAGRTVAVVGQSGSGKSTIIGLIERFYDPLHGRVLVDGADVRSYNLRALRSHIGLVAQEPSLFATSIRNNIAYGARDDGAACTEAEVVEAAKAANAHAFISSLPDGYDTYAGARGVELSGGQKQRIAIARAVLKNPSILLLDEATSALDAESESVVQKALDKMMVGRTTVVVAHRLSTIRHAHTIAVLQDGSIVEQGTHKELLAKGEGGAYFALVRMQNTD